MLLGGIEPRRLLGTAIITGSTILLVAAVSITVSVRAKRVRDALLQVYVILFGLLVLPSMLLPMLTYLQVPAVLTGPLAELHKMNPFSVLLYSLMMPSGMNWSGVEDLVRNQLLLSVALTALATWSVRRVHLRGMESSVRARLFSRRTRPRRPVSNPAMLWKETTENLRFGLGRIGTVIVALAVGAPLLVALCSNVPALAFDQIAAMLLNFVFIVALLGVGVRAAGCISGEARKRHLADPIEHSA